VIDQELEPLPRDLDELLDAERSAKGPPSDVRGRVRARVLATVALPAAASATTTGVSPATAPSAPPMLSPAVKIAIAILAGGAGTAGLYAIFEPKAAPPPVVSRPAVVKTEPPAPPPPALPPPVPAVIEEKKVEVRQEPQLKRGKDQLAAERALIESAKSALNAGELSAAMSLLERHNQRYPNGALAEEREGLRVISLAKAGLHQAAHKKAAEFKQRYPRSIFTPMIDASLKSIP
jgi:hypothetical protein